MTFKTVLNFIEKEEVNPEEEDGGPAREPVHLFPHIVVTGAHLGQGKKQDID